MNKTCPQCGEVFVTNNALQRYCCVEHRNKFNQARAMRSNPELGPDGTLLDVRLHRNFDFWFADLPKGASTWVGGRYAEVYVRYARHYLPKLPAPVQCIDIANIRVKPAKQKHGVFSNFLTHVESYRVSVFIENVLNTDLHAFLDRRLGYTRMDHANDRANPSYYKVY